LIGLIAPGVIGAVVSSGVGVNLHNSPANEKQGLIPEETSQTLLTNKSKETWTTLGSHRENKFKTGRVPYLGLELPYMPPKAKSIS
jgi:hypothetical protein